MYSLFLLQADGRSGKVAPFPVKSASTFLDTQYSLEHESTVVLWDIMGQGLTGLTWTGQNGSIKYPDGGVFDGTSPRDAT